MDMPKPTPAHRKLDRLVGTWTGEEKLSPSPWEPKGGIATGRVENRAALDGFAVIQEYEQVREGKANFKGHGVFSCDPASQEYSMHWFDSMGAPPSVYKGSFEGDVLSLTSKGQMGHSRAIFDFSREGAYNFKMQMSQDGVRWDTFMEGTYVRGK